jgi:hypothetical protein
MAGLNGYRALELAHNGEPVPDRLTEDAEYYHQRFVEEAQGLDAKCQRYKGAWLENRFLAVDIKLKDTAPHTTVADDRERASKECDASFDAAWERVPESGSSE